MIHARLRRQLSLHLDGSLSGSARVRVEQHLAGCESCRAELAELRGTVSLLGSLAADDEPPAGFTERVARSVAALEANPSRLERLQSGLDQLLGSSWAPAFGAVALLVVAAGLLRVEVDVMLPFRGQESGELATAERAPFQSEPALAPSVGEIGAFSKASRSAPLETRRRFDPISLWHASGLRRACLASPNDGQCHRFYQEMMSLALEDTPAFIEEVDSVPMAPREQLLGVLSSEAVRSGSSARIVSRLRAADDPRAVGIVVRFERSAASRD